MTYTLRYDEQGYATAIERDGYTVLHLQAGTERNEEEASSIVNRLNRTVADEQINELLWGGERVGGRHKPAICPQLAGES